MLQNVITKTLTEDREERKVYVYAHNMRDFDRDTKWRKY